MTNITNFLNKHAAYIWDTTDLHHKESTAKLKVFLDFGDNADNGWMKSAGLTYLISAAG